MRTPSMQISFPETVSDSLCRNSLVMQTDCCSSCPGGWFQTILEVKMLDVAVLGWCGYTGSAFVRPVWCTVRFSETPLEMAYGREMNIQFTGNSSGGHFCSQYANCNKSVAFIIFFSIYVCVCVSVCVYIYIYVYICICMYVYINTKLFHNITVFADLEAQIQNFTRPALPQLCYSKKNNSIMSWHFTRDANCWE